jgi:hypothetical protein
MSIFVLLVLLAAPQKGIIPIDIVEVGPLKIGSRGGTPDEALAVWIEGHRLHKEGKHPAACAKYVEFLAMAGHRSLPARYAEMARERVDAFHDPVRKRFEKSCVTYPTDRAAALAVWRDIAEQWPVFPEGYAALQLWQSDALREAIDDAKVLRDEGRKKEAIGPLEKAVRSLPEGLYRYEATTLLVEVGGPDLRSRKDTRGEDEPEPDKKRPAKEGDGESEIEINDD